MPDAAPTDEPPPTPAPRVVRTDTVVLGAGPAGLATAACLTRAGVPFVLVDRADAVGSAWRRHYDRLHLHTEKRFSALPFAPWPEAVPRYPSRAEVVTYLERYAARFGLEPELDVEVTEIRRVAAGYELEAADRVYAAKRLCICTGYNHEPHRPTWPGEDEFAGEVLHSRDYRNGEAYRGKRALVIGIGNTGGELAIDLVEHGAAAVSICVRSPIHVSARDVLGISAQAFGIALRRLPTALGDALGRATSVLRYGRLERYGMRRPARGPVTMLKEDGRVPLIDIGTMDLIAKGRVSVVPGIERFTKTGVRTADGRDHLADVVVLATGYRSALAAVLGPDLAQAALDANGRPRAFGAEVTDAGPARAVSDLYFVGFRNPISGMLREIALEAERVGRHIASRRGAAL